MRKVKLLPSVLMLVLCVAVLAIGVYAAAPVSHSIQGSINVSAAGANVRITAYLDKTGDGYSNDDTVISNDGNGNNYLETRTNGTLNINTNALDFTEANMDAKEYSKNVILEIHNKSSIDLGAYFPVGEGTTTATAADIASVKHLDGTSTSGTISDVVKCQFGPYTQVASNATAYLKLDLSLAKLSHFEAVTVGLNLTLNLENYNANLAEVAGVNVYTNNQNVALTPATTYGQTAGTALTATKTDRYSASALTLDQGTYPEAWGTNVKKHETTKVSFTITNNGDSAVSVDVVNNKNYRASELKVVTLGNSYIPAGGTGEVSVQFTVLDSAKASLSTYSLNDICVDIDIYEATSDTQAKADIQSRIAYTETAVGNNWHYYIEYGVNPYNNNEPLRWFIWAYDNEGTLTTIGNVNPTTTEGTYYFISEYVLDTTASNYGISFQNMYEDMNNYYNIYDEYASDYSGSNYRNYMNGLTVKRAATYNSAYEASGDAINFYESFGLTSDAIFAQIETDHVQTDKFWGLSYDEYYNIITEEYNNTSYAIAYNLPKA